MKRFLRQGQNWMYVPGALLLLAIFTAFGVECADSHDEKHVMTVTHHEMTQGYTTTDYCTHEETEDATDHKGRVVGSHTRTETYPCGETWHPPTFSLQGRSEKGEEITLSVDEGDYQGVDDGTELPIVINVGGLFGWRTARLDR